MRNKKLLISIAILFINCLNSNADNGFNMQELELKPGMKFKTVKHKLKKFGWKDEKLSCGEGLDAVCGARFTKEEQALAIYTKADKDRSLISIEAD